MRTLCLMLLLWAWGCSLFGAEPSLPPGFDPARHMLVSEVKPGMKGYGLSVFSGTRIERFNVEVISILRNFTPKQDVVLIRATGQNLEHTGAVAGMSGSPIYLNDEHGRSRLIGAFAYGWPMVKDPVAGVQPIQYMLAMPLQDPAKGAAGAGAGAGASGGRWSALNAFATARRRIDHLLNSDPAPTSGARMASLMVPVAITGIPDSQLRPLTRLFAPMHVMPLQAGGGGTAEEDAPGKLEPGAVMAIPLLTGDVDMTALGTCTEIIGDRAYGFGHPFTSEGSVAIPLSSGYVNSVIANLQTSFKIGGPSRSIGTLLADQTSGVAGRIGEAPPTAPITLHVHYADGSLDQTYRFQAVMHPQFTPLLATTAIVGSVSASRQLPHLNTLTYSVRVRYADGQEMRLANMVANADAMNLLSEIAGPLTAIAENPYARILAKGIEAEVEVATTVRAAEIISAGVPRRSYRPGETIGLNARIRPFRGEEIVHPLTLRIPDDLADGTYQLVVSDVSRYLSDEQTASPYRFTASNLNEVFVAANSLADLPSDAVYLRLAAGTSPGVAVGRTVLPNLPPSQRNLLTGSGRSQVSAYVPAVTRTVQVPWVLTGASELTIQVSRDTRAAGKIAAPATAPHVP